MLTLTDDQLLYILEVQLPEMLERQPELEPRAYHAFLRAFATKGELAAIVQELREIGYQAIHARTEAAWNLTQVRDDVHDLHAEMTEGFTQVRGEIQNLRAETTQRFEQVDQRFDQLDQKMDDLKDWVHLVVGGFQVRAGKKLEDVVAGTLRLALQRPDINPDRIRLRQKVVDEKGLVGPPGQRRFEIDILTDDEQITVFEVKSVCEAEDVDRLADKITLIRALHPDRQVTGVMIALGIEEEAQALCAQYGISLVH